MNCLIILVGISIFSAIYWIFKSDIAQFYSKKSAEFLDYYFWIIPVGIATVFFMIFDYYLRGLHKNLVSVFLQEIVLRCVTLTLLCLFAFEIITFDQFLVYNLLGYFVPTVFLLIYLIRIGEFHLSIKSITIPKRFRKILLNFSLFSYINTLTTLLVISLDTMMIASFIGLTATGVYTNIIYLTSAIQVPYRSVVRVSSPLIAKYWKEKNIPEMLPDYKNKLVSSYEWVNQNGLEKNPHMFFAPDLVDLIQSTPGMEIGTHTYSHYYCQEKGQTVTQFESDLKKANEIAISKGITIEALVFPRNQFNADYMDVCKSMGIKTVRTNPSCWYWDATKKDTLIIKILRTGDAWLPINRKSVVPLHEIDSTTEPMQLPASRLYKAWTNNSFLNALKMRRIFSEMTEAAKTGACYHLWWHPHNLGYHPNECLNELSSIVNHYKMLHNKYGMLSLNMKELRNHLKTIDNAA
jgi:hypothetical protein